MKITHLILGLYLIMFSGYGLAVGVISEFETDTLGSVNSTTQDSFDDDKAFPEYLFVSKRYVEFLSDIDKKAVLNSCPIGKRLCCEPEFCYCAVHCV